MTNKNSRVLGIVCAAVCLFFTLVYFNVSVSHAMGLHVNAGLSPIETIRSVFNDQLNFFNRCTLLLSEVVDFLAAILLFVAVLGVVKGGTLLRVLPVALLVLDCVIWLAFYSANYKLFGYYDVWSSLWNFGLSMAPQLAICGISLVAFVLAIVLGKKNSTLPLIVASGLSAAALIMLIVGVTPFGRRDVGGSVVYDSYVAYISSLVRYVAIWFGTAFACMETAPGGSAANAPINSSGPVANGFGGGVDTAGRASWGPAPSSPVQGGPRAFCTRCGASIGVADKFCRSCGMPTNEASTASGSSPQGRIPRT